MSSCLFNARGLFQSSFKQQKQQEQIASATVALSAATVGEVESLVKPLVKGETTAMIKEEVAAPASEKKKEKQGDKAFSKIFFSISGSSCSQLCCERVSSSQVSCEQGIRNASQEGTNCFVCVSRSV